MPITSFEPLSGSDLRDAGIPEPWSFGIADKVRFVELDILNHVNNAAYVNWLENARIAYFMDYGISDYVSPDQPVLVVRSLKIDFRAPLLLNDTYIVTARSISYGRTSWKMEHAIFSGDQMAASAENVIVTVSPDGDGPVPLRPSIIDVIRTRDGATPRT